MMALQQAFQGPQLQQTPFNGASLSPYRSPVRPEPPRITTLPQEPPTAPQAVPTMSPTNAEAAAKPPPFGRTERILSRL